MVSRAFQRGSLNVTSQIQPLVDVATAAQHWAAMPAQYKHAGDRNYASIPKGAVVQCTGGDGHIFMSEGGGVGRSTDYPSVGKIGSAPIATILAHFSGNPYAGWGAWINGRAIQGLVTVKSGLTSDQVKVLSAYLNGRAASVGKPKTSAVYDGDPGKVYWTLVQAIGHADGLYPTPQYGIDGAPGPKTLELEQHYYAVATTPATPPPPPVTDPPVQTDPPTDDAPPSVDPPATDDPPANDAPPVTNDPEGPGEVDVDPDEPPVTTPPAAKPSTGLTIGAIIAFLIGIGGAIVAALWPWK